MRAFLAAVLAIVLLAPAASAKDGASVRASIDRSSITIGDRIQYVIEVIARKDSEAQLPAFKDGMVGEFEIKDSSGGVKSGWFGKRTLYRRYYITAYETGTKTIPDVEVKYRQRGAKDWLVLKTRPLNVIVASVLPKSGAGDIRDIKGPLSFYEINWILAGGSLALALLALAAIRWYIKAKQRRPVRLPHETALEELEAARSSLLKDNDAKEYFAAVSDCIRRYIERVFRLKAPEMTTEEFLNSLGVSSALSIGQKELLRDFLSACDLVKFAKYAPSSDEAEKVYTTAKGFVEETKEAFSHDNANNGKA